MRTTKTVRKKQKKLRESEAKKNDQKSLGRKIKKKKTGNYQTSQGRVPNRRQRAAGFLGKGFVGVGAEKNSQERKKKKHRRENDTQRTETRRNKKIAYPKG